MRRSTTFLPAVRRDYDVPVPHDAVPAFLESLEEAARELGSVPILVGVTASENGVSVYLESARRIPLQEFAQLLATPPSDG